MYCVHSIPIPIYHLFRNFLHFYYYVPLYSSVLFYLVSMMGSCILIRNMKHPKKQTQISIYIIRTIVLNNNNSKITNQFCNQSKRIEYALARTAEKNQRERREKLVNGGSRQLLTVEHKWSSRSWMVYSIGESPIHTRNCGSVVKSSAIGGWS